MACATVIAVAVEAIVGVVIAASVAASVLVLLVEPAPIPFNLSMRTDGDAPRDMPFASSGRALGGMPTGHPRQNHEAGFATDRVVVVAPEPAWTALSLRLCAY